MKLYINLIASFLIASISFAGDIELQNPSTNQKAPDFSGINSYGEMIRLSDFIGKPVILEWTNHECPYVARHYNENNMQAVQKLLRIRKSSGSVLSLQRLEIKGTLVQAKPMS